MKYRTKVIVLLMAMVFVTTGISVAILYWHFERVLRDQIGSQILSVAATTAAFLDGDLHKDIKKPGDETSNAYIRLRDAIRRARDANRRDDFYVKFAYTLTVDPKRPTSFNSVLTPKRTPRLSLPSARPTARSSTIPLTSTNTSMTRCSLRTIAANF
jgi:hypothetical protein